MLQQGAYGTSAGLLAGGEGEQLGSPRVLQDEQLSVLPGVLRLAGEPLLPLRRVGVAYGLTRRHDEAVVQKAHDLVGWLTGPVEPLPPDDSLVTQSGELGGLGDLRAVVAGDVLATLVDLISRPAMPLGATSSKYRAR